MRIPGRVNKSSVGLAAAVERVSRSVDASTGPVSASNVRRHHGLLSLGVSRCGREICIDPPANVVANDSDPLCARAAKGMGLTCVTLTEAAPLAVVFDTDAKLDPGVAVVGTFPPDTHPPIVYPVAAVARSTNPDTPRVLAFLRSAAARAIFAAHGYAVLPVP